MTIHVGDTGALQGILPGMSQGMFFGSDTGPASSAFYLRVKSGPSAGVVFSSYNSKFTTVSNGPVTGNFTPASPAQVVTVYDAAAVARVTQTVLYVAYQKRFNVIYEVQNLSGAPLQFIAGAAADLYIGASDSGTGIFIDGPRRFVGGTNTSSQKVGGLQEFTLSRKPGEAADVPVPRWASYGEGNYSTITSRLNSFDAFDNTINPNLIDNGAGVSWDDRATTGLPAGQTARYEVQWVAEQTVPLTAFPAQASRELPGRHDVVLTLADASGSGIPGMPIRYRVNGVNATPANPSEYLRAVTNQSGQVLVSVNGTTPGIDTVLAFADVVGAENGVREAAEPQSSAKVTWLADNHVAGPPSVPPSLNGPSGTLPVGTVANPDNAEAPTYTFGRAASSSAGFETCTSNGHSGRRLNFPIEVDLQPGAGTIVSAFLLTVDPAGQDPNATGGATAPPAIAATSSAGNRRGFVVECVTNTDLWVRFTLSEGGVEQTFVIPIGGLLLIDPQGVVYDRVAYDAAIGAGQNPEQARASAAITGATRAAAPQRGKAPSERAVGRPGHPPERQWTSPPPAVCSSWRSPMARTGSPWPQPASRQHESRSVDVPPPVLDLHIPIERPPHRPIRRCPRRWRERAVAPIVVTPAKPGATASQFGLKLPKSKGAKAKLSKTGILKFGQLTCPKSARSCYRAKVVLRAVSRGKGKRRLPATLGKATFALRPGHGRTIRLKLSKKTTRLLRARKSTAVSAHDLGRSRQGQAREVQARTRIGARDGRRLRIRRRPGARAGTAAGARAGRAGCAPSHPR